MFGDVGGERLEHLGVPPAPLESVAAVRLLAVVLRVVGYEPTGYEPFAQHAPIHWAMQGYVIKNRG